MTFEYLKRVKPAADRAEYEAKTVVAAVSIIAPLSLLIMVFQRQIVSGLTAAAVKG